MPITSLPIKKKMKKKQKTKKKRWAPSSLSGVLEIVTAGTKKERQHHTEFVIRSEKGNVASRVSVVTTSDAYEYVN